MLRSKKKKKRSQFLQLFLKFINPPLMPQKYGQFYRNGPHIYITRLSVTPLPFVMTG